MQMQHRRAVHIKATNCHRIRISAVVGIRTILIDNCLIFTFVQEIQRQLQVACLTVGHTAHIPVVGTALLTGIDSTIAAIHSQKLSVIAVCEAKSVNVAT